MCGIAGLIHRGKSSNVGLELQGMLQALKHRGEDSTGYALYGDTDVLPSPTFSPTLKRMMKFLPSVSPYKA